MTINDEKTSNTVKLLEFWGNKERKPGHQSGDKDFWGFGEIFGEFGQIQRVSTESSPDSRQKWRIQMISDQYHAMQDFHTKAEGNGYSVDRMSVETVTNHEPIFRMGSRFILDMRPRITQIEYDITLTEILI